MIKTKIKRYSKVVITVVAFFLVLAASYFRIFDIFELTTLDWRFKMRPLQKVNTDVVFIEIANDSIEKIGRWPFDRMYHATLIDALSYAGVKAILFDIIFSEPSPSDQYLVDSTKKAGNVYFAHSFKLSKKSAGFFKADDYDTRVLKDLADASKGVGFINITADIDGKNRRAPLLIEHDGKLYPQLSFLLTCDYLGIGFDDIKIVPNRYIILDNSRKIPIDKNGATLINFAGFWSKTFTHYSYVDILKSYAQITNNEKPLIDLNLLKDKVCFIGLTATGLHDLNPVPLEGRYPMIGLHANLFNEITTKNFLKRADEPVNMAVLITLLCLVFFVVMSARPILSLVALGIIIPAFLSIGIFLFILYGIWIDIFYPLVVVIILYLGVTFFKFIREIQKRQLIENELLVAKRIQENFLPQSPPRIDSIKIAVNLRTAKHVGGDLYDFVTINSETLGIMIGDVSGKGVPAALFMAKVISDFRFWARGEVSPSKVTIKLNNQVASESKTGLFVTFLYMVFNHKERVLNLSNAAHLTPILMRSSSNQPEFIGRSMGLPIGLMENQEFGQETVWLSKGDIVVVYTDGVTEARNRQKEEFSEERLINIIKDSKSLGVDTIVRNIQSALDHFVGKASQHDDITILAVEVK